MPPARLSIRCDIDIDHARQVLGYRPTDDRVLEPSTVAFTLEALRQRLEQDIATAYPEARVSVVPWPHKPNVRPTKVRYGFRVADGLTEARCALIREHVDALRSAAIAALRNAGEDGGATGEATSAPPGVPPLGAPPSLDPGASMIDVSGLEPPPILS